MKKLLLITIISSLLVACSTTSVPMADSKARWAIMPLHNYTNDEDAAVQLERMIQVLMPSRGVTQLLPVPSTLANDQSQLLNQAHRRQQAQQWALQHNIDYKILGSVERWNINTKGLPVVDIHLKLVHQQEGDTLWETRASATGQTGESLHQTARKLLTSTLDTMPIAH